MSIRYDNRTCEADYLEGTVPVGRVVAKAEIVNIPLPQTFIDHAARGGDPRQELRVDGTPRAGGFGTACEMKQSQAARVVAITPLTVQLTTVYEGTRQEGCTSFTSLPPTSCVVTRTLVYGGPLETSD